MNSEKLGGLSYGHVLLLGLALLCALCALFSHAGILYPSEASRKPGDGNLTPRRSYESPGYGPERRAAGESWYPRPAQHITVHLSSSCLAPPTEDNLSMAGSSWFPKRSETEMRRVTAETLYDLEMECRRQGWGADPALVFDEERELFRFRDGKFAFSREHMNWELLRKRGRLKGIE